MRERERERERERLSEGERDFLGSQRERERERERQRQTDRQRASEQVREFSFTMLKNIAYKSVYIYTTASTSRPSNCYDSVFLVIRQSLIRSFDLLFRLSSSLLSLFNFLLFFRSSFRWGERVNVGLNQKVTTYATVYT